MLERGDCERLWLVVEQSANGRLFKFSRSAVKRKPVLTLERGTYEHWLR
jgi:hypothetical protein